MQLSFLKVIVLSSKKLICYPGKNSIPTQVLVQLLFSQLLIVGKSTYLHHMTISIKRPAFKGSNSLKTVSNKK